MPGDANKYEKKRRVLAFALIMSLIVNIGLVINAVNWKKALFNYGVREYQEGTDWRTLSWGSCIRQLELDVDVAFFGDSITRNGDWQSYFPERRIINLGLSGDSVFGMTKRVETLASVKPEKIFILGGINSLTNHNVELVYRQYSNMIAEIKKTTPSAELYIQSVLPIGERCKRNVTNETIQEFNRRLQKLAEERGAAYVDLFSLYVSDGNQLRPEMTKDDVHITPEAYVPWIETIRPFVDAEATDSEATTE